MASGSAPDQWPPDDLAVQLDQPSPHAVWPPDDLAAALTVGEGLTQLSPVPTAAEHAAGSTVSPAVLRARYGASAGQGGRGDGDPGGPR
jgi:hypothetical protein